MKIPTDTAIAFAKLNQQLTALKSQRDESLKMFPRNNQMRQHFDGQIQTLTVQRNQALMQVAA